MINLLFEKKQSDIITFDEYMNFCKTNLPKITEDGEMYDVEDDNVQESSNTLKKCIDEVLTNK